MKNKEQIGRLAMRQEGGNWVAYYAMNETMDGAIFLGSIVMAGISGHNGHRKANFMDMMRDIVSEIIEDKTGIKPEWGGEIAAPEHERAGNA